MGAIIPAILPKSRADLDEKLARLSGIAREVQIDVVDGKFASPATWPYLNGNDEGEVELLELGSFTFDIDLMVEDPEDAIDHWVRAGATRMTVHAETTRRLNEVIERFQVKYGRDKEFTPGLLALGLAINVDTDISLIEPFIEDCDYVQFMGIARIGKQGEPFDTRVIPKIHSFHRRHPNIPIQVDGGVSLNSAAKLIEAGATRLVVGSALWNAPDLEKEFDTFCHTLQTHGLYS